MPADQHSVTSTVALYSLLCFCGLCQLVLCVAASVLCCRGVCCRSRKTTGAVLYNATTPGGGGAAGAEAGGGAPGAAAAAQVQAALLPTVPLPSGTSATLTVGSEFTKRKKKSRRCRSNLKRVESPALIYYSRLFFVQTKVQDYLLGKLKSTVVGLLLHLLRKLKPSRSAHAGDKPPKYEDATGASREDQEGSKYQRFE